MKRRLTFHTDPGHGWLEVPHAELKELGIDSKISEYSYHNSGIVYLEEDCDAGVFIDAIKAKHPGIELIMKENYKENTPIRNHYAYGYRMGGWCE